MSAKHTPGPWQFENQWNGINAIHTPKGELIATLEKHAVRGGTHNVDECNANARLIAAAPDLRAFAAAVRLARETPGTPSDFEMRITLALADLDLAQPGLFIP